MEKKRNESSTAHIRSMGLSASACVSRIPKAPKKRKKKKSKTLKKKSSRGPRKKDLPFSSTVDYLLLPKHHRALISRELDIGSHIFPLYLFKCLFEERVLKFFLCCTIFITPGGHPTLLLNICKLLTIFPHATFFFPYDQALLYSAWPLFETVFHPSLQDMPSIPLYFWLLPSQVTLPPCHSCTLCCCCCFCWKVAPLRYLHHSFSLNSFISPGNHTFSSIPPFASSILFLSFFLKV